MQKFLFLSLVHLLSLSSFGQEKDSFTDARDGIQYSTVHYTLRPSDRTISDQDEYGTYVNKAPAIYEISLPDSFPASITWMAQNLNYEAPDSKCVNKNPEDCGHLGRLYTWPESQKACPEGWHLPSDAEWFLLAKLYGGVAGAGEHLKNENLGGSNKSGFDVRKPAIYWSADEVNEEQAYDWKVNYRWKKLQRWPGGKKAYNSIRCVQDY